MAHWFSYQSAQPRCHFFRPRQSSLRLSPTGNDTHPLDAAATEPGQPGSLPDYINTY